MAHDMGVPVLYYIAPQLWASREGRIAKVQKYVDRVACILPFEEKYYKKFGVNATFVGHPLFDELPKDRKLAPEPVAFTAERPPVVGIMPGSRQAEVRANLPRMFEVADEVKRAFPGVRFEIPTTPPTHELVEKMVAGRPDFRLERNGIDAMAPGWDFCVAKSGTTTLHLAAYGVPMVVVYHITKLAWTAVGRWMIKTPSIALVNILAERSPSSSPVPKYRIAPEIVPWNGPTGPVSGLVVKLLGDVAKRAEQRRDLLNLVADLDKQGASRRAAEIAMEMMKR
jgi:lipid-A-disaccharide synthase